jgi:hypothetical protein
MLRHNRYGKSNVIFRFCVLAFNLYAFNSPQQAAEEGPGLALGFIPLIKLFFT